MRTGKLLFWGTPLILQFHNLRSFQVVGIEGGSRGGLKHCHLKINCGSQVIGTVRVKSIFPPFHVYLRGTVKASFLPTYMGCFKN